jgi:hypothetical protein
VAAISPAHGASRVIPGALPAALAIQGDAAPRVPFDSPFSQRLTVAGAHGPLSWSFAGEGQGLTIDADGVLSGTLSAPSVRQITVRVADGSQAAGELHLTLTPVLRVCENLRPDGAARRVIAAISRSIGRHIEDHVNDLKVEAGKPCGAGESEQGLIVECQDCSPQQNYWVVQLRRGAAPFKQRFKVPSDTNADPDRLAQDALAQYKGDLLQEFVNAAPK